MCVCVCEGEENADLSHLTCNTDSTVCLNFVSLFKQSQIPDFQYSIVPPRHDERVSTVPGDHIDISVMCTSGQHASL